AGPDVGAAALHPGAHRPGAILSERRDQPGHREGAAAREHDDVEVVEATGGHVLGAHDRDGGAVEREERQVVPRRPSAPVDADAQAGGPPGGAAGAGGAGRRAPNPAVTRGGAQRAHTSSSTRMTLPPTTLAISSSE